jgi:hypothetical protein
LDDDQQELRDLVNNDADGFLYHYTSLDALIGIAGGKILWASHIKYLNDTSEQDIMRQLLLKEIQELIMADPHAAAEQIDQWRVLLDRDIEPFFVLCFSEDGGDRLSQWRAYGGTSGVCLKFNKSQLQGYCRASTGDQAVALRKVRYVAPEGDPYLNAEIEKLLKDFGETASDVAIPVEVSIAGAFLKHQAFREEKEWRIIVPQSKRVLKHRVRGSLLVPYVELDVKSHFADLLEAVIVGPISHREQTAKALQELLRGNGLSSIKVLCSDTPYRGF